MKPYYDDGRGILIYHGDCREILPSLPKVDLVLTDPPYGAGYAANPIVGKGKSKSNHEAQTWDDEIVDINPIFAASEQQIIWGGNYYRLRPSRRFLIWLKRDAPPSMANVELAWTSFDANAKFFDFPIAAVNSQRIGHPTQKPVELMTWCMGFMPDAKTILDPFMGSGTTLVAAKSLGRKCIGVEIEERYCSIAARRLQQQYLPLITSVPDPYRLQQDDMALDPDSSH